MKEYIIAASVLAVAYLGLKMRCVRQMLHRHPRQPVTYVPFDSIPSTKTLPEIVRRYYSVIAPDGMIPVVSTFAFAGTAHVKVMPVETAASYVFSIIPMKAMRHDIDMEWFGLKWFHVVDLFAHNEFRMKLPFGVIPNDPKTAHAAMVGCVAESLNCPFTLLFDDSISWRQISDDQAVLSVPCSMLDGSPIEFTVTFDKTTGLPVTQESQRFQHPEDKEKTKWRIVSHQWRPFNFDGHDLYFISEMSIQWGDNAPWSRWYTNEMVLNVEHRHNLFESL